MQRLGRRYAAEYLQCESAALPGAWQSPSPCGTSSASGRPAVEVVGQCGCSRAGADLVLQFFVRPGNVSTTPRRQPDWASHPAGESPHPSTSHPTTWRFERPSPTPIDPPGVPAVPARKSGFPATYWRAIRPTGPKWLRGRPCRRAAVRSAACATFLSGVSPAANSPTDQDVDVVQFDQLSQCGDRGLSHALFGRPSWPGEPRPSHWEYAERQRSRGVPPWLSRPPPPAWPGSRCPLPSPEATLTLLWRPRRHPPRQGRLKRTGRPMPHAPLRQHAHGRFTHFRRFALGTLPQFANPALPPGGHPGRGAAKPAARRELVQLADQEPCRLRLRASALPRPVPTLNRALSVGIATGR